MIGGRIVLGCLVLFLSLGPAYAASLPNATQEMLKKLNLSPALLGDMDKQLEVPKDWIEKAKKEGKVRWRATPTAPSELKILFNVFKERYPFLEAEFSGTNQEDRSVKTLVAYKSGRILADMVSSVGGFIQQFKEAGALEDIRDLPNVKVLPEEVKDAQGLWVGINQNYFCMSYNTKLVKKESLPKKWEDLLTQPQWKDGNLVLGNRPQVWVLSVWKAKGEDWTKQFLTRLFLEVKPQLRREGLSQLVNLVAAGEAHAAIPSNNKRPFQLSLEGAPVAFTCPEPAPTSVEDTVILKGAPNIHAAKIFLNWFLSREGQIAQYLLEYASPLDRDLRKILLPFGDQILGRQLSFRDENVTREFEPKMFEFWNSLWLRSRGSSR
jgi:ABC-type Fe3+ transport system substrate-binding protein